MRILFFIAVFCLSSINFICNAETGLPSYINKILTPDQLVVLSVPLKNDHLRIVAAKNFGGSIVSMTFRGKQYVNNDNGKEVDYGRQIQSAVTYDEMGECFNPTEAGGRYDKGMERSSSKLLSVKTTERTLETTTDMAFWMLPGDMHAKGCGSSGKGNIAKNKAIREGYILKKKITAGNSKNDNIIKFETIFESPVVNKSGRFEPMSIHLTNEFQRVYLWKGKDGVKEDNRKALRSSDPIILTTNDGKNAMGIYMQFPANTTSWYGMRILPTTSVIRCAIEKKNLNSNKENFTGYLIIGSLDEVIEGMKHIVGLQATTGSLSSGEKPKALSMRLPFLYFQPSA